MIDSKIHLGDMLDLIKRIDDDSVGMILTDPPYGISFKSNMGEEGYQKDEIINDSFDDWLKILPKWLREMHRVLSPGSALAMFCSGGGRVAALPHAWLEVERRFGVVSNVLIWDRCDMGLGWRYRPQWEAIILAHKGPERCWNGPPTRINILRQPRIIPKAGEHPTPKPVPLLGTLIEDNTNPGDLILDPFCGSGSTWEAAHLLGRLCVGFELKPEYHVIAERRRAGLLAQPTMF